MRDAPFPLGVPEIRIGHLVQILDLDMGVEDDDRAFALSERIAELNRTRLIPLIEAIFDEFDRPAELIRIDRLDLDLGHLGWDQVDEIEVRLASALRLALRKAMPPPLPASATLRRSSGPDTSASATPVAAALIEAFEHWLLHGTWPWRSGLDATTAPADLLASLIAEEPAGLVLMLRRRGRSEAALRRLAEQVPEAVLERLLRTLEPTQSAYMLAFMSEARAAHKVDPVVEQPPERFALAMWTIVLRDALHSAGLRANRRAFVVNLIARLAEAEAIPFDWLLRRLQAGLRAVADTAKGADSLLSILAEIGQGEKFDAVEEPGAHLDFASFAAIAEGTAPVPADEAGRAALRKILIDNGGASRLLLRRLAQANPDALGERLQGLLSRGALAGLVSAGVPLRTDDPLYARKAGPSPENALALLIDVLESGADTGGVEAVLRDAASFSPLETRGLLRRYARADAAALLDRIAPSSAQTLFHLILPSEAAEAFAALAAARGNSPDEQRLLLEVAAQLPLSAAPALLLERAVQRLAQTHRSAPAAFGSELAQAAKISGGEAGRRLAAQLQALEVPADTVDTPEQRRLRALDLLRAMAAGSTMSAESLSPLLPSLAGIPAQRLRATLSGLTPHPRAFASALARLDIAALLRLAFLLTPSRMERLDLRARLAAGTTPEALAQIVASLLAAGALPPATIRPPRPEPATDAVLAEALARGEAALRTPAARRAIAWALRQSPTDLLATLARRTDTPATRLLSIPGTAALLLGAAHPAEQLLLRDLGRLLTTAAGRNAMPPEKVAAALLSAASQAAEAGRASGLAGRWLNSILAAASLSQRSALLRLIERRWPDTPGHAAERRALGLAAAAASPVRARPAPGSPAWLVWLLDERPRGWQRRLRAALASPAFRARAARSLPQALLARLLAAAAPRESRELLRAAEIMRSAFAEAGAGLSGADLWQALLAAALAEPGATIDALLAAVLDRHPRRAAVEPALARRAAAAGRSALSAALEERTMPPKRKPKRLTSKAQDPSQNSAEPEKGVRIAIANAGLVLTAPYLPTLFERLGLIIRSPEGRFTWLSPEARDRGVHLLQYLVEGRCDRPEPMLALNKLLCGQPLSAPTSAGIEPTEQEREMCESLLGAMLANWPLLKGSSVAALQETFFQRAGILGRTAEGWRVDVERKVLDILVDNVPWSFGTILHPWMPEPVTVTW